MLVAFQLLFFGESFGLEIWHDFFHHEVHIVPKFSWSKDNFSTVGRVSKLVAMKSGAGWRTLCRGGGRQFEGWHRVLGFGCCGPGGGSVWLEREGHWGLGWRGRGEG
jgi:hypothetical protein